MVITIRPARPDDAPGVRYVGTVSWPATYGSDKGAAYVMSGLDQFWNAEAIGSANQAGNIYVAESEQGIVGMVHVEELGADMVMWKLYVLPDHQLHGIGRLLLGAAKSHAGAHGKGLVTEYDPSNERVRGDCFVVARERRTLAPVDWSRRPVDRLMISPLSGSGLTPIMYIMSA